jgi:hypothetical protein
MSTSTSTYVGRHVAPTPKHRKPIAPDSCRNNSAGIYALVGAIGCEICAAYSGQHRKDAA